MIRVERIVNRIFNSNTYVIFSDDSPDVWLVDVGDTESVLNILPSTSRVRGVFLTHTHFDHLYGINELYDVFPEMAVYVSEEGVGSLFSAKMNLSKYHESPLEYKGLKVVGVCDGCEIDLFSRIKIKAILTQGHSRDSMSYILGDNYIFTGDAYIPNVAVVSKLPGGNKKLAVKSRQLLIELSSGKVLCPGHGGIIRNM